MKILFLCHRFPYPADGGGKIRVLEMLRHLNRSHEVHLVSMVRSDQEARLAPGLNAYCASYRAPRVHPLMQALRTGRCLLTGESLSVGFFGSRAVQQAVNKLTTNIAFDCIIAHCSAMGPYVEGIKNIPALIDFCDMDSEKWRAYADHCTGPRRWLYRYEQRAVQRLERRLAARAGITTVATPGELQCLRAQGTARTCALIPVGVDVDYFSPLAEPVDPNLLCFVGRMDYFPNESCAGEFCRDVWPRIRQARPAARFAIVGANPTPRVRALADLPGVEVTGTVPDVRPWLGRAVAMVAPLRIARGTQNKLLEALAMGVPVVTSTLAAQGLAEPARAAVLCADSAAEVFDAVMQCMTDPPSRAERAASGLAAVRTHCTWPAAMRELDELLRHLVSPAPLPAPAPAH